MGSCCDTELPQHAERNTAQAAALGPKKLLMTLVQQAVAVLQAGWLQIGFLT